MWECLMDVLARMGMVALVNVVACMELEAPVRLVTRVGVIASDRGPEHGQDSAA